MKYTVIQAAKIVGKTRQTIYRHIDSKPISVTKDDDGNQLIEASELIRVYGNNIDFEAVNSDKPKDVTSNKLQDVTPKTPAIPPSMEDQIKLVKLEAQIETLKAQLESKEDETTYIKQLLEEEKAERKAANNLLEDHREKESQWEKQFRGMESRVANIEKSSKIWEDRARKQLKEKKELQASLNEKNKELEENNKNWFRRLFG